MQRYWEVQLKDGTIIREGQMEWREVPKKVLLNTEHPWFLVYEKVFVLKDVL